MRRVVRRVCPLVVFGVVSALLLPGPAAAGRRVKAPSPPGLLRHVNRSVVADRVLAAAKDRTKPSGAHVRAGSVPGEALAPTAALGFDAIPRIGYSWPADPAGAMGNHWFLAAVNTSYEILDLTGAPALGPLSLRELFTFQRGTQVYDPKVVYDQYQQTFVLVFLAIDDRDQRSSILVVSIPDATATDTTTWCAHRLAGDQVAGNGKQWSDYPGLGFDLDRVTVTTNVFDFGGREAFEYVQILSFPKSNLYDCNRPLRYKVFSGTATQNPDGTRGFTLQPAVSVGTAPSAARQYLVSFQQGTALAGKQLTLWRLSSVNGHLELREVSLLVGRAVVPPYGTQGGGSTTAPNTWWDTGDLRLINAFFDADRNRLYTAHAVKRNLLPDPVTGDYAEAVIRWYEIAPAGRLLDSSVTRKGIIGEPETDAAWPAMATDSAGNLFVAYSRASAVTGEFLSAWAAEIPPDTNAATTILLVPGQARLEVKPGPERWGDFNSISRDPTDPSLVAMVNQYTVSVGTATTIEWREVVDLVRDG